MTLEAAECVMRENILHHVRMEGELSRGYCPTGKCSGICPGECPDPQFTTTFEYLYTCSIYGINETID